MTLQQRRNTLCARCEGLVKEKNDSHDPGAAPLAQDYDMRVLLLIRDILIHTHDHWDQETDAQRRASLSNIVSNVLLLSREFTYQYNPNYPNQAMKSEEINFWRNIAFLIKCKISQHDPRAKQTIAITPDEVNTLLRELIDKAGHAINLEHRLWLAIKHIQGERSIDVNEKEQRIATLKARYERYFKEAAREADYLPFTNAFVSHHRSQLHLRNIIDRINRAQACDPANEVDRTAFLRHLQAIGESFTGKNFSRFARRLSKNIDFDLFVRLRNKLSHNEWDIHRDKLMTLLTPQMMQDLQADLLDLRPLIENLQQNHNLAGQTPEDRLFNSGIVWTMRLPARQAFEQYIQDLQGAGLITQPQADALTARLQDDISYAQENLLTHTFRPLLDLLFDEADPNFSVRGNLRRSFGRLIKVYTDEQAYCRNAINPDGKSLKNAKKRLAAHHVHIRNFEQGLDYSEESYKEDLAKFAISFDPLRLLESIEREMLAMEEVLLALDGSAVLLQQKFPEDRELMQGASFIFAHILANNYTAVLKNATQMIITYLGNIGKEIYLEIDNLKHLKNRREQKILSFGREATPQLVTLYEKEIIKFGNRCRFHEALRQHPNVVQACIYHMARIQKLIVVLMLSPEVKHNLEDVLKFEEIRALRNFVQHGNALFDVLDIPMHQMATRYSNMFLHNIRPILRKIAKEISDNRRASIIPNAPVLHAAYWLPSAAHSGAISQQQAFRGAVAYSGFLSRDVAADGNCLFLAVAEQMPMHDHNALRQLAYQELNDHRRLYEDAITGDYERYIQNMRATGTWADHVAIQALARAANINIVIFNRQLAEPYVVGQPGATENVYLHYVNGNHYRVAVPQNNTARRAIEAFVQGKEKCYDSNSFRP